MDLIRVAARDLRATGVSLAYAPLLELLDIGEHFADSFLRHAGGKRVFHAFRWPARRLTHVVPASGWRRSTTRAEVVLLKFERMDQKDSPSAYYVRQPPQKNLMKGDAGLLCGSADQSLPITFLLFAHFWLATCRSFACRLALCLALAARGVFAALMQGFWMVCYVLD
jgi:hypothetical protein